MPGSNIPALLDGMRASDGEVAAVTRSIGANVYVGWRPDRNRFEWCAVAGPARTVTMYETTDRNTLLSELTTGRPRDATYPVAYTETPFSEIPVTPSDFERGAVTLDAGYRARCSCGTVGIAFTRRRQALRWAYEHEQDCDGECDIEQVGPHSPPDETPEPPTPG